MGDAPGQQTTAPCWEDAGVTDSAGARATPAERTHPRTSGAVAQAVVLLVAAVAGLLLGAGLLAADRSSWHGARTVPATVTGRSDKGVTADAAGTPVVLHLARIPAPGTIVSVQVTPDGRARPLSYAQTPARSLRTGVLLLVGMTLLVQVYRFAVTRRPDTA